MDGVGSQLEQLTNQDTELARQLDLATQASAAETAALDQQRAGLAASISSLERQRTLASDQVNLAQSAVRRATGLARQGAGSQRQVEDARSTLLARRADVESLGERLIAQRAALRNAEAQGAQRQIEASRTRSVLLAQRASLAEQRAGLCDRRWCTGQQRAGIFDGDRAEFRMWHGDEVPAGGKLRIGGEVGTGRDPVRRRTGE